MSRRTVLFRKYRGKDAPATAEKLRGALPSAVARDINGKICTVPARAEKIERIAGALHARGGA